MPINYYCDVEVQSNVLTTDVSNSRVGVNLGTPLTTLHVDGTIRAGGGSTSSARANLSSSVLAFLASSTTYGTAFISSNNFYINTGTSGGTLYIGAPAANTTNLNVQGTGTFQTISNATSDTDKFLVSDGGVIKYRTGAEVRSDIGAGTGDGTVTGTGSSARVAFWNGASNLTSDSEFIWNSTNNRLGIGVGSSPQVALDVKDTSQDTIVNITGASGGKPQINIYEGTNNVGRLTCTGAADFNISNENSGNINFFTGGTTSMTIASNGTISMSGGSLTLTSSSAELNLEANGDILMGTSSEFQIDGDAGSSGQYIKSTGSGLEWATLPDTTKTQTILFSNFLDSGSTTSTLRMPFNTLVETSSNQYYNYFDVPASGTIKRVRMQNTSGTLSTGFTTTIYIWKNSSGGSPSYTSSAQTASGGEIEVDPNLSISKGDKVQIGYAKSAGSKYWQGVSATVIIEFTKI